MSCLQLGLEGTQGLRAPPSFIYRARCAETHSSDDLLATFSQAEELERELAGRGPQGSRGCTDLDRLDKQIQSFISPEFLSFVHSSSRSSLED